MALVGDRAQISVIAPAPSMIGTGKDPFAPCGLTLNLSTAMASHVQKDVDLALPISRQQEGQPQEIFCDKRMFAYQL